MDRACRARDTWRLRHVLFPGGKADTRSIGTDFLASSAVPPAAAYSLDIGSMPPRIAR
jgi:hypothetical protein